MKSKANILCTLGPASLNKNFLKFSNSKISLLRLNMSHLMPSELPKMIKYIRKFSKVPICIDTEGAQIRTKVKKKKYFNSKQIYNFNTKLGESFLYPETVKKFLRKNDILDIGFSGLKIKIMTILEKKIKFKVID